MLGTVHSIKKILAFVARAPTILRFISSYGGEKENLNLSCKWEHSLKSYWKGFAPEHRC